jgi:ABC-2 type transport system permease protein
MRTLRSEWRKLISIRLWVFLTIAALGFTALNAGVLVILSGAVLQGEPFPSMTDPAALRGVYTSVSQTSVIVLVLGILSMTSEYRHQTITATVLATPSRVRLVLAKMAANAVLGAAIAVVCLLLVVGIMEVGFLFKDHAPVDWSDFAAVAAGVVVGFGVYAVLGVGYGSLVRNQIAAITTALIWVLLVEGIIVAIWPQVGKWLPGGAFNGMVQGQSVSGNSYLDPLPAALLLLAYAAAFGAVAVRTTLRRDIT